MASELESAMGALIRVFLSYKEGNKCKLNRAEMKNLVQGELANLMSASKNPQMVDEFMRALNVDQDREVDFQEFVVLVAALTGVCDQLI